MTQADREAQNRIGGWFRTEAARCGAQGSPLYSGLLGRCASDIGAGGSTWDLLRPFASDPPGTALPLRLMGSVHRLVLTGRVPALATWYPSAGGSPDANGAWPAFQAALSSNAAELSSLLHRTVQTNESGRSVALLGGFLMAVREGRLPLRLLEIGASAGLNLCWDRFRYESGAWRWGEPTSPVRFADAFTGAAPPTDCDVVIVERLGCDTDPVDARSQEGALTLLSYVWADQPSRIARLRAAIDVAGHIGTTVQRASGDEWLSEQLVKTRRGVTTVVFHSIVIKYMPPAVRESIRTQIETAGAQATAAAPLVWLRMEPAGPAHAEVLLTTWPAGRERLVATAPFHGVPATWLG